MIFPLTYFFLFVILIEDLSFSDLPGATFLVVSFSSDDKFKSSHLAAALVWALFFRLNEFIAVFIRLLCFENDDVVSYWKKFSIDACTFKIIIIMKLLNVQYIN